MEKNLVSWIFKSQYIEGEKTLDPTKKLDLTEYTLDPKEKSLHTN